MLTKKQKEFQINKWKAWDIKPEGFFISKSDESGTIWIAKGELEDLKELIKRVETQEIK